MEQVERDRVDDQASSPGDEGRGIALLGLFTFASVVVVVAVWTMGVLDSSWALVLAVGVHLTMTAIVTAAVVAVVGDSPWPPRITRHQRSIQQPQRELPVA